MCQLYTCTGEHKYGAERVIVASIVTIYRINYCHLLYRKHPGFTTRIYSTDCPVMLTLPVSYKINRLSAKKLMRLCKQKNMNLI